MEMNDALIEAIDKFGIIHICESYQGSRLGIFSGVKPGVNVHVSEDNLLASLPVIGMTIEGSRISIQFASTPVIQEGEASWFRLVLSHFGWIDGSIGVESADMTLPNQRLLTWDTVHVASFRINACVNLEHLDKLSKRKVVKPPKDDIDIFW